MKKSEIRKEIKVILKNGTSKIGVYESLRQRDDIPDVELRKLLASIPDANIDKIDKVLHKIICVFWVLFALIEIGNVIDGLISINLKLLISFIVTVYITVQIWRFNGDLYLPAIVWLGLSVINALREFYSIDPYDPDYELYQIMTYVYISVVIIVIALMIIVRKNVFGYYKWFKPEMNFKNEIMFENYKTTLNNDPS
ncbi:MULTISPECIES: hypothetical protein [unclassified Arenibacter]|jgi:hypothetical protein|uniref:hypothetical protein n=1 Tax=unclassified Arenibacter TaxID=2615047 RepID=UPI000E350BD5|nr:MULTISPECIES: hypothetical protein [unclassified Arenibacter]MCM4162408.1 hypothetical protein [Arenibacter sp. A80]RFT58003.1 hypothetical protein D0S24_02245 [Arenibacter sp. P308M17]